MSSGYTLAELIAAADGMHNINCPVCGEQLKVYRFREPAVYNEQGAANSVNTIYARCRRCKLWEESLKLSVEQERKILKEGQAERE